jgi:hypothetical protein
LILTENEQEKKEEEKKAIPNSIAMLTNLISHHWFCEDFKPHKG